MIGLKDFVKETLVQIVTGVQEAQDTLADADALINPPATGDLVQQEGFYPVTSRRLAHLIELDIAVSPEKDGGVVVASSNTATTGVVSRLHFRIGIAFPTADPATGAGAGDPGFELEV